MYERMIGFQKIYESPSKFCQRKISILYGNYPRKWAYIRRYSGKSIGQDIHEIGSFRPKSTQVPKQVEG